MSSIGDSPVDIVDDEASVDRKRKKKKKHRKASRSPIDSPERQQPSLSPENNPSIVPKKVGGQKMLEDAIG